MLISWIPYLIKLKNADKLDTIPYQVKNADKLDTIPYQVKQEGQDGPVSLT